MKYFTFILSFLFSAMLGAQPAPVQTVDVPVLEESGQLFTIRYEPGKKESRLFVNLVGEPTAELKMTDLGVQLKYGLGKKKKSVILSQKKNYFIVPKDIGDRFDLRLKMNSPEGEKTESFSIQIEKD